LLVSVNSIDTNSLERMFSSVIGTYLATNIHMSQKRLYLSISFAALLLIFFMEFLYLQNPQFIQNINSRLIDAAFVYRGEIEGDKRIVIVDVDERSLKDLGQWPWSRNKIATLLNNLTSAGAAIIGLDMVFAEKDSSSPVNIAKEANISVENLPDFDQILAKTLSQTPTILGFTFDFEKEIKNTPPPINAIYIQRGKNNKESLPVAKGITTNLPQFQKSAYSSGSFNTIPDNDGIIRYVPLLISYDDSVYPSLSFEIVRALSGEKKVEVLYDENGLYLIKLANMEIPVNSQGKLFINFRGPKNSYEYISALDIYKNNFDKSKIDGKIILIGTSAAGLLDLRATPFESVYPGVEVHANVIDNIINDDFIVNNPTYDVAITMVFIFLSVLITALILTPTPPLTAFGLIVSFMTLESVFYYKMLFEERILLNSVYVFLSTIVATFLFTFIKVYFENRQKEIISQKFSKKVSPQVAQQLLKSQKDIFSASEQEITIFFSDIREFTSISESFNNPKILIEYLNTYMSPMSEIIISHGGTIDKYIGDAIMAYWNAPLKIEDHADKAVSSAVNQIEKLKELNETLQKKNFPPIDIGIGIHTGLAIAGEMGSEGRSDYTVIGDSINLGSRIEGLCKTYGSKILISEDTKERLRKKYKLREIDTVRVKGKNETVTLYEVVGFGEFNESEKELNRLYDHAKRLYKEARFKEARKLFEKANQLSEQKLFELYIQRCKNYEKEKIREFDAVYRFTTK